MDPKNIFRRDPRFRKQVGPKATPLARQPIMITCEFPDGQNMQFKTDRPTNAIELGGIALTLLHAQFQMLSAAIVQNPVVDRNAPHEYDQNEDSEKSVRGLACGKCGQPADALIHLGTENDNPDLENNPGSDGKLVS